MSDVELVEEFLSKKNLDGVDKFLLDKYVAAIRNVSNNSIPKEIVREMRTEKINRLNNLSGLRRDLTKNEDKEITTLLIQLELLEKVLRK